MKEKMIYEKSKKTGGITPQSVIGNNGEGEVMLMVNMEDKLFKRIKYNPSIQIKVITLPVFNDFPLFVVMLMVDRDTRLLFDSVWNYYNMEYDTYFNSMKTQEEIKVVLHNNTNSMDKMFVVENKLKVILRENIKFLKRLKTNVTIKDFELASTAYRNNVNMEKLWYSDMMKSFMGDNNISSVLKKEQVMESENIYFSIDKYEVDDIDFDRITDAIEILEDCGAKARGKIILTFDGYECTDLEIFQIVEIRNYVKKLFENHNNLFYFLSDLEYCNVNILSCLMETTKQKCNGITYNRQIKMDKEISFKIFKGCLDYAEYLGDISTEIIRLLRTLRVVDESHFELLKLMSEVNEFTNVMMKTAGFNSDSNYNK